MVSRCVVYTLLTKEIQMSTACPSESLLKIDKTIRTFSTISEQRCSYNIRPDIGYLAIVKPDTKFDINPDTGYNKACILFFLLQWFRNKKNNPFFDIISY